MIYGADWVLPIDGPPIERGAVRIEGDRIAEVGADLEPDERFAGCAILPGLINAHTHLEYAVMSGFGDGHPFDGWIADHIRRRDGLRREDYLAQAREGVRASLAGGVTTVRTTGSLEPYADLELKKSIDAGESPGPKTHVTGPYLEGKEHMGGLVVIDAPDLDAALEWGRRTADAIGLPIEVRPFVHE